MYLEPLGEGRAYVEVLGSQSNSELLPIFEMCLSIMKLITFITNISYFAVKFITYIEISEPTKSTGKCINSIIYLFFVLSQQQT